MKADITLQVNICPGDTAYADRIARRLAACHGEICAEKLLVLDRCRPQSTQFLHAESMFPEDRYAANSRLITEIAQCLVSDGTFDRLIILDPNSPLLEEVARKYLGGLVDLTHDCFGHASLAYYAGFEAPSTRYVVHYDSDIFLYQTPGFQWPMTAIRVLQADGKVLAVSPRISPPGSGGKAASPAIPYSKGGGWLDSWIVEDHRSGWISDWFSTRCFLIDRDRLKRELPLIGRTAFGRFGRHSMHYRRAVHRTLRKTFQRGGLMPPAGGSASLLQRVLQSARYRFVPIYPEPPEVLLHEVAGAAGGRCVYLDDSDAWFIHPDSKPAAFHQNFEAILASVAQGDVPDAQLEQSGMQHDAWQRMLAECKLAN